MDLGDFLRRYIGTGWNPDVQMTGVRPDYGLSTVSLQPMQKSPYERTLAPGEKRTRGSLASMLGEVILAGGAMAAPEAVGAKRTELRTPRSSREPPKPVEAPPPLKGFTRLYRGEPDAPSYRSQIRDDRGWRRWFSIERGSAQKYADSYANGRLIYVDVPTEALTSFTHAKTGMAPDEYFVPASVAKQAQRLIEKFPHLADLRNPDEI